MFRLVVLLFLINICSANDEHWFVFDQNQFAAFQTQLVSLISPVNQRNFSIYFSSYERSIQIDIQTNHTLEQTVKLNVERADFLYNTPNHLIFFAIRQDNQFETYANCKLIDSYLFYSTNENASFEIENLAEGAQHFEMTGEEVFEKFGCKQSPSTVVINDNQTTTIGKPLIRKMQHVIEKVQKRKQRSKRHQTSPSLSSDSVTIVYKPNIDSNRIIVNISQFGFSIHYYQKEHLFYIQFNNENRTQILLYADKTTDVSPVSQENQTSNTMLFLHITPMMITCYVNCELTDQEFVIDSVYLQNIIRESMAAQQTIQFNRQSTLVLFNRTIEQVAANFFCLKLDKKYEDILPDKYALRKFATALDILVNSLDTHVEQTTTATTPSNISAINIYSINGFGSLKAPTFASDMNTFPSETIEYDRTCSNDNDCYSTTSFLKCFSGRCRCATRSFWSKNARRCLICQDLSIGNRCFRLSSHKSTWYESNDYCQDEHNLDEQQIYSMKLASNLNRTDIELLKRSLLQDDNTEQLDYFYWIGATSQFDTQKLHNKRTRRNIPTTIFRWYDNGETAQLNQVDIWCSQNGQINMDSINNNEQCVSLTSCGLYADNCQRNYRFLCEAI